MRKSLTGMTFAASGACWLDAVRRRSTIYDTAQHPVAEGPRGFAHEWVSHAVTGLLPAQTPSSSGRGWAVCGPSEDGRQRPGTANDDRLTSLGWQVTRFDLRHWYSHA